MRAWLVVLALVAVSVSGCVTQDQGGQIPESLASSPSPTPSPEAESDPEPEPQPESKNETPEPPSNESKPDNETQEPEPEPEPGPKPVWGDSETAPVYPGVYVSTRDSACTANFVFTSLDNRHIYIGTAAHCFGEADVDPCDAGTSMPPAPGARVNFTQEFGPTDLTPVTTVGDIHSQNVTAVLAYNSWYTQRTLLGEADAPECTNLNDFALIEIPLEAQGQITPVWRHFGIAASEILAPEEIHVGDEVIGYGHSSLWLGMEPLYPKHGVVTGTPSASGEYLLVSATVLPVGTFGDSGSPLMTPDGSAIGVAKTLGSIQYNNVTGGGGVPATGTNGFVTLHTALEFMEFHTDLRVQLASP